MNKNILYTLKAFRKLYTKIVGDKESAKINCEQDPDVASDYLFQEMNNEKPSMIARFGSTELTTMVNYLGVNQTNKSALGYITGKNLQWWWNENTLQQMNRWSGFFPPTKEKVSEFCELMMKDMKLVDVLGSWVPDEKYFVDSMSCKVVHLRLLEPFWAKNPWTKALEGKKVLVVHPFASTILEQYKRRDLLFDNPDVLPKFESLGVIQAVQTLGSSDTEFKDWFDALDSMKRKIDNSDYDVCLIGAGAYGFPLAAHVKRQGKKAVHLGGALQLLFGIKGKRWEDPNYGVKEWGIPYGSYSELMNEYWVRPQITEKPKTADAVEGACYW
ncbi:hypothetical protein [Neptunitalea lumnitzerae]|uniref:Uncharacterized protein n=1 Tax=Neptunitalea lumnitzerae TaxID=2965509 RepID=A0ABQ5MGY4_9FLAO|nr:hypothetical protein [Neptunitalea sp. Y10]GLB48659.1 hypothetical protein Y10_10270 [Neptunitalea sp. Y10]